MRFFTDENFEDGTAYKKYERYCRANWQYFPKELKVIQFGQLPEEMLSNLDKINLHDSRVLDFNQHRDTITIKLKVIFFDTSKVVIFRYFNVKNSDIPDINLLGGDIENPNSDLMRHEVHIDKNFFTHTILFASGKFLKIHFHKMEISEL